MASHFSINVGATLHEQGRYSEADALLGRAVAARRKTMPGSPGLSWALMWHGRNLLEHGRLDEAEAALRESATLSGKFYPVRFLCRRPHLFLGRYLVRRERYAEAAELLEESYARCDETVLLHDHPPLTVRHPELDRAVALRDGDAAAGGAKGRGSRAAARMSSSP